MLHLPPELLVLLISALPITEVRIGIITGKLLGLPLEATVFWAIIGNMLPMFFLLKWLKPVSKLLIKHSKFFEKILKTIFEKTHKKHSHKFDEIGAIFLVAFIAIPFPGTGAWTGALLAFLFNIPYWRALVLIFLGIVGSAIIVSLGVSGLTEIRHLLG